ncbi:hypothetical protein PSSM7_170 [Prochlorococcus phage P-SSM7]|uniref:Uncharacterized protein n=1 Tax=Prochlorococcus phage P-SSM7 TaxID=445688 RepID=E3SNT4_9CAUD|nr:hypothetical protein PSSM7_170 [Prochlorococcus phage P-SSM7]ADO98937.1 hypothetical protein PSSM7_170 [Prochlorococcus phage P-SSM7]
MDPIHNVPNITLRGLSIPDITVNGTGIPLIGNYTIGVSNTYVADIRNVNVRDTRNWLVNPPQAVPVDVPVTVLAGTPIVNMPGCVTVHKENAKKDPSTNKNLVNDDPKGQTTLCDAGMPYYQPPDYDYRELFWQTINTEPDDVDEGVDTDTDVDTDFETPGTPEIPSTGSDEVECPPPNARRIGDRNQKGDEQVKEYKLTPDGKICETIWEPVPAVEQFLPSAGVVTTTATIATVATASALFAKPLADLLLKAVKPVVKKVMAKIQKLLGKKEERRPNLQERQTEKYREKKGLPPLKKKG